MKNRFIFCLALLACVLIGCSNQAVATKEEEDHFRHPSKFPPAEAVPGGAPKSGTGKPQ